MTVSPYVRRINYYETDKMSIVHHSNYIRYLEEARIDFMDQCGLDFVGLERMSITIPVTDVSCKYLQSARFGDTLEIFSRLVSFNGVRFSLTYELRFPDGTLCATGASSHCFLDDATNRPIALKRRFPEVYQRFCNAVTQDA